MDLPSGWRPLRYCKGSVSVETLSAAGQRRPNPRMHEEPVDGAHQRDGDSQDDRIEPSPDWGERGNARSLFVDIDADGLHARLEAFLDDMASDRHGKLPGSAGK